MDVGTTAALDTATYPLDLGDGRFRVDLSPAFASDTNSPNGGYAFATVLRVAKDVTGRDQVATASAHFLRPLALGPCEVTATVLRSGRRFDVADLRIVQGERVCLAALVTLGDPDSAEGLDYDTPGPDLPPLVEVDGPPVSMPINDHFLLETPPDHDRYMRGEAFDHPRITWRVRLASGEPFDERWLPILADWRPPGPFLVGIFGLVPTVELDLHVLAPPPYPAVNFEMVMESMRDGQVIESTRMWDDEGRLVATARQLLLLVQGTSSSGKV